MWIGTYNLTFRDRDEIYEKYTFNLPKEINLKFLSCYLTNYTYSDEVYGPSISLVCYSNKQDKDAAKSEVLPHLVFASKLFKFFFGSSDFYTDIHFYETTTCLTNELPTHTKNSNVKKLSTNLNKLTSLSPDKLSVLIRCAELHDKAQNFYQRELLEESILQSFKTTELLANEYFKDYNGKSLSSNLKADLKCSIEQTYKHFLSKNKISHNSFQISDTINKMCKSINSLDEVKDPMSLQDKILALVTSHNLHNQYSSDDIKKIKFIRDKACSHGNIISDKITTEMLSSASLKALFLSRNLISKYFFSLPYSSLALIPKYKYGTHVTIIKK